jgi:hypothetical protein
MKTALNCHQLCSYNFTKELVLGRNVWRQMKFDLNLVRVRSWAETGNLLLQYVNHSLTKSAPYHVSMLHVTITRSSSSSIDRLNTGQSLQFSTKKSPPHAVELKYTSTVCKKEWHAHIHISHPYPTFWINLILCRSSSLAIFWFFAFAICSQWINYPKKSWRSCLTNGAQSWR